MPLRLAERWLRGNKMKSLMNKMTFKSGINYLNNQFAIFVVVISIVILVLNYNTLVMDGIWPYYRDYASILFSFDKGAIDAARAPTFPMWGYGWVFNITENKFFITIFQMAMANVALLYLVSILHRFSLLALFGSKLFKVLAIVAIPYFAINCALSPYGLASSLFILSVSFLLKGMHEDTLKDILYSGIFYGLTLNFRSDLLYFCIPLLLVLAFHFRKAGAAKVLSLFAPWVFIVMMVMAPWALYTKHVTGHYLLGSTNSGHVLFIGLGQLPFNTWGITPSDGDPVMGLEIESHFGEAKSSLLYESDVYLKDSFLKKVKQDPIEYIKKSVYSMGKTMVDGSYSGQFYLFGTSGKLEDRRKAIKDFKIWRGKVLSDPFYIFKDMNIGGFVQASVETFIVLMKLFSLILLPVTIWFGLKYKDTLALLVSAILLYQTAILVFAYNMRLYNVNVYIFHMLNLAIALAYLLRKAIDNKKINLIL